MTYSILGAIEAGLLDDKATAIVISALLIIGFICGFFVGWLL